MATSNRDIILHFNGHLDYDKIGDLISILKRKMKELGVHVNLYKKLLTLLIESLENIVRYNLSLPSLEKYFEASKPDLVIASEGETFYFIVSNIIRNEDIKEIEERLIRLNDLNQDELKKLYKETITDGKFSDKGGAGLGIIEMAKISDDKLKYAFIPREDSLSLFTLTIKILPVSNEL